MKGNQKRDFVYVTDVCDAFYKSLNRNIINKIFNIGSGNPKSINYLVKLIRGKKTFIKKTCEPDITHANISFAKRYLNWSPKVSLDEGIKNVITNIDYWKMLLYGQRKK